MITTDHITAAPTIVGAANQPAEVTASEPVTPQDTLRLDGSVDPRRVRLFRGPHGVLRCTIDGDRSVLRAKVVRAFPISHQNHWINILDWKNKEVCLIENPDDLDPESRRLAGEAIDEHYRIATIERIYSIENEYRTLFCDVLTNLGRRDFVMKWASDTIVWLGPDELMLVDIDTNRFRIPDINRLDAHSRKQLGVLL
ncbi:MAG: DUF1854 domain-containing protein [Chloroflexi bacterium]|nr:DUF1854 domain-containing protein [Chloroflexota bacterium]